MLNQGCKIKWLVSKGLVDYRHALSVMARQRQALYHHDMPEAVWLLEHAPLYTAGISAKTEDILNPALPVYHTRRGGKMTYHGPGQRVAYVMMDLRQRKRDVRQFIRQLEDWIVATLAHFGIKGEHDPDHIGVWVEGEKIAAIGVQLSKWISSHGIAINLDPDLDHFRGIIPCGIKDKGVTSLAALGCAASYG